MRDRCSATFELGRSNAGLRCTRLRHSDPIHQCRSERGDLLACWRARGRQVILARACPGRVNLRAKCADCPEMDRALVAQNAFARLEATH